MTNLVDIRRAFLDYFVANGHQEVASSPLVPRNDPSLLFVNSGMVQFKNALLGLERRPYQKAVSSQKCVRAGGKHNDLDNVGYTARHHTFFEMLGNFAFGALSKDNAVELAWRFVTKELGLPQERLLATVYYNDTQAAEAWKRCAGFGDDRIIRIRTSDNFWQMGDVGPCGPCTELYYDHGPTVAGGPPGSPEQDGDRFIEIWNLVFMQFQKGETGTMEPLAQLSIDTGMGLERLCAVLQGKHNNFEIDLFQNLIEHIATLAGQTPSPATLPSYRIIADHLRTISFLIAEGVLPDKEGRGYVLRRILRRALRHVHLLGIREPFLWRLVGGLGELMGGHFTELVRARSLVEETIKNEEQRFLKTLDRGLGLLDRAIQGLPSQGVLSGEIAFALYDTYGFPLDLTADILRERHLRLDEAGFEAAMKNQREKSREHWAGSGETAASAEAPVWFDLRQKYGPTVFLGYETEQAEGLILALLQDQRPCEALEVPENAGKTGGKGVENVEILTNQTPFYAEAGGQESDQGFITTSEARFRVTHTRRRQKDLFAHQGVLEAGVLRTQARAQLTIDAIRRKKLRASHSATHLLNAALHAELGPHIAQKGSLVEAGRFRFDISHPQKISSSELRALEARVNAAIAANWPVTTRLMEREAALAYGAMALLGETYDAQVRVVRMGPPAPPAPPASPEEAAHEDTSAAPVESVELCGGTHVQATGEIGAFRLIEETSIAAGIRRLTAVTGAEAVAYTQKKEAILEDATALLRCAPKDLVARLQQLLAERREYYMQVQALTMNQKQNVLLRAVKGRQFGPITYHTCQVETAPGDLRAFFDDFRTKKHKAVFVFATRFENKAILMVAVSADLTDRFSAKALLKVGISAIRGSGGGQDTFAQGGGPAVEGLSVALERIRQTIEQAIEAQKTSP